MIITFIRSSSINNYDYCSNQYYITYVLGMPHKAGLKALKGTCTHAILECLANAKLALQNGQNEFIIQETKEKIYVDQETWLLPSILTNKEVMDINRTRINKSTYKHPCRLNDGHIRYGVDFVQNIIDKCYNYYSHVDFDWKPVDYKDVNNWVWMELDYNNGAFDPRRRTIIKPEQHFDIELPYDWAKYEWDIKGKKIIGKLGLKGTIDLVTEIDSETIEVIDYKSGQRLDWATGEEKTYKKLQTDFQLLLYHYVVKKLYSQYKTVFVTIFFIRDGGPFTLCFDDLTVDQTEAIIQERFETIKAAQTTKLIHPKQEDFRCTKLCDFYKLASPTQGKNYCQYVFDMINEIGMDNTTKLLMNEDFDIGYYEAP